MTIKYPKSELLYKLSVCQVESINLLLSRQFVLLVSILSDFRFLLVGSHLNKPFCSYVQDARNSLVFILPIYSVPWETRENFSTEEEILCLFFSCLFF